MFCRIVIVGQQEVQARRIAERIVAADMREKRFVVLAGHSVDRDLAATAIIGNASSPIDFAESGKISPVTAVPMMGGVASTDGAIFQLGLSDSVSDDEGVMGGEGCHVVTPHSALQVRVVML